MTMSDVLFVVATIVVYNHVSNYYYEQDNAARRDPMDNLAKFHHQLKSIWSSMKGNIQGKRVFTDLLNCFRFSPF